MIHAIDASIVKNPALLPANLGKRRPPSTINDVPIASESAFCIAPRILVNCVETIYVTVPTIAIIILLTRNVFSSNLFPNLVLKNTSRLHVVESPISMLLTCLPPTDLQA